jgi:uncharacterized repeat protein (TIGR03803 family)
MRFVVLLLCGLTVASCSRSTNPALILPSSPGGPLVSVSGRQLPLFASLTKAPVYKLLYTFKGGKDASGPGPLVQLNGALYGSSEFGGGGAGTVFAVTTSGKEHVVYNFPGGYGAYVGGSKLTALGGALYGTTIDGGANALGTIFSVTMSGKLRWLYSFKGGKDGAQPTSNLAALNGSLYGLTYDGDIGTVYRVSRSGAERVIYTFQPGPSALEPQGELVAINGIMYGTAAGGKDFNGAIFSVTTSGVERTIYNFKGGTAGSLPFALVALGNELYGTTLYGGANPDACEGKGCGIVFKMALSGNGERTLHVFQGSPGDAAWPSGGLLFINTTLYGTSLLGGSGNCESSAGCGAAFAVDTAGNERVLYSFKGGEDGEQPSGGLISENGALYGTTFKGGSSYSGVFYRISP